MDENRIGELLTRKISGEASPQELGELLYLLSKYPDAKYYEALLEQVWELGQKDDNSDIENVYEKHKLKFKEELQFTKQQPGFIRFVQKPAVFITVFILSFVGTYFLNSISSVTNSESIEIVAGKGIRKEIKLPDGTFIRLNSDSKISYYADMDQRDERHINLTGEAFFNVAHNKKKPFVVSTNKVVIRVLGTEFNVKEYPGEQKSETTLMKGSIELTINGRSDQKFLLKPSEKFALLENGNSPAGTTRGGLVLRMENISPLKVGNKEYLEETSWIENKLVFQNESLEDLLPKLERWYNVEITLEDPMIRSYRFTGVFIEENINQALEAMKIIKPFNYKITANEVKIY